MKIGSVFSGIGGIERGLCKSLDADVVWQIENDDFCRGVLERHFPNVKRYGDVRTVQADELEPIDLLAGGFPCQDLSDAARGRNHGLAGDKSGLWFEMYRLISGLAPRWIVIENVAGAAVKRWVPRVRGDLYELGYASVPFSLPASHVGAPHRRTRIWMVAYPDSEGQSARAFHDEVARLQKSRGSARRWAAAPRPLGVDDGLPDRLQRIAAVGNSVVPQCAELIGEVIRRVA